MADLHAAPVGRPSYPPLLMVKVLLLQQWYQASDPAMEEALWERLSFRRFVGLGLQDDAPDHSTISRFRTRLTAAGGAEPLFAAVEQQLAARGMLVKQGTLVDATLVAAQVRRPKGGATGAGSPRDPDAAWARRGPQARFGYKLHLGVDADSELVRRAVLTPANVNETTVADGLIAGDEGAVYGDAAYGTHARSARLRALGIADTADATAHQTSAPARPDGAPPPRPDRTGATAGGARVWDVEALVRLPAGALPGPGPEYDRDVVQAPGLQPAPRGPVAGRRPRAALGALRPRHGAVGRRQGSAGGDPRCPTQRHPLAGRGRPSALLRAHYSKVSPRGEADSGVFAGNR